VVLAQKAEREKEDESVRRPDIPGHERAGRVKQSIDPVRHLIDPSRRIAHARVGGQIDGVKFRPLARRAE